MSGEEFVILLGEESEVPPKTDTAVEDDGSFVILLDQSENDIGTADLTLPSQSTIENVKTLYADLQALDLEPGKEINVDGADVSLVDTATLQVLLGFIRESRSNGVTARVGKPSEAFRSSADRLGLSEELGVGTQA